MIRPGRFPFKAWYIWFTCERGKKPVNRPKIIDGYAYLVNQSLLSRFRSSYIHINRTFFFIYISRMYDCCQIIEIEVP
jgi:hypothetical protein